MVQQPQYQSTLFVIAENMLDACGDAQVAGRRWLDTSQGCDSGWVFAVKAAIYVPLQHATTDHLSWMLITCICHPNG